VSIEAPTVEKTEREARGATVRPAAQWVGKTVKRYEAVATKREPVKKVRKDRIMRAPSGTVRSKIVAGF